MVSQCGAGAWLKGLASGDQRRLTGGGSALEACSRRCAIQMVAFTLLLLFYLDHLAGFIWKENKGREGKERKEEEREGERREEERRHRGKGEKGRGV